MSTKRLLYKSKDLCFGTRLITHSIDSHVQRENALELELYTARYPFLVF